MSSLQERYQAAAHKVQSGLHFLMHFYQATRFHRTEPKHLRVGIDISKAEQAGLAKLLIAKGVFTDEEYLLAMTEAVEEEANRYRDEVRDVTRNPTLELS